MSDLLSEFESPKKKQRRETDTNENVNVEEYEIRDTKHLNEKLLIIEQYQPERIEDLKNSNDEIEILYQEKDNQLSIISEENEENISSQEEQISQKFNKQMEMMRNDLKCGICGEEFHEAVTLNCSHTFCKFCIEMWKTKNLCCPICRTFIISECRSLVIDSFVENMLQTQSENIKRERKDRLKDREDHKLELVRELSRVNVDENDPDEIAPESNSLLIYAQDNTALPTAEGNSIALAVAPDAANAAGATQADTDAAQPSDDAIRATADTNNVTIWSTLRWLWQCRRENP